MKCIDIAYCIVYVIYICVLVYILFYRDNERAYFNPKLYPKPPRYPDALKDASDISNYNVGNSDYHTHKYQPWDAWQDYQLDPWDADIAKRIMRHKADDPINLDYEKIKHICDKQLQRIELGQKEFKPAGHEENSYDRFEDYHFDQRDSEILEIVLRHGAYYSLPPCYLRIQYLCDQQLQRIKLGLKK